MNKKALMSLIAVGVIASGLVLNTTLAKADEKSGFSDIVSRIAEKFNLEEEEVQAVFDSVHDEHMQEMKAKFEDRLSNLVDEGKLTEEQKQALIAKHQEMELNLPKPGEEASEDLHAQMKARHEEFRAWAEEEGIDLSLIGPMGFKIGGGKGDVKMFVHKLE